MSLARELEINAHCLFKEIQPRYGHRFMIISTRTADDIMPTGLVNTGSKDETSDCEPLAYARRGPNDEQQSDLMDIGYIQPCMCFVLLLMSISHHTSTLMLDGKLFLAPIDKKPQRCLDVGTGTGIWAMFVVYCHSSTRLRIADIWK